MSNSDDTNLFKTPPSTQQIDSPNPDKIQTRGRRDSKKKKLHLHLKLDVPQKKQHNTKEFEITDSLTFKWKDIEITPHGLRGETWAPQSATSNHTSGSEVTPESITSSTGFSPAQSDEMNDRIEEQIQYEQLDIQKKSKLGTGASANVILVKYKGKPFALKIIHLYQDDMQFQPQIILSEIKSLYESMSCPYIVRFYEAFHRENSIQLLLEYMDCGSLEDVYKIVGKIPEDVLSEITYQILLGLDYLASKKIIHRDIKPSNILLNRKGEAKISDFGMSKQLTASLQAFRTFKGTYMYMSPERLKGEEHSFDSDIWSVGVTIAECVTGKFPFDLKQYNLWEVLKSITETSINVQKDQVSPELYEFLTASTRPKNRPSAAQLLQYKWITMHKKDKPENTIKWIHEVYIPEKRRQRKLRKLEKEKMKKSPTYSPKHRRSSKEKIRVRTPTDKMQF